MQRVLFCSSESSTDCCRTPVHHTPPLSVVVFHAVSPREVLCRMQNVLFFQKCLSCCKYHCEYFCIVTIMFVLRSPASDRTALWPLTVSVNQPPSPGWSPRPPHSCCLLPAWSLSHKSLFLSGTLVSTSPYLLLPVPCTTCRWLHSFSFDLSLTSHFLSSFCLFMTFNVLYAILKCNLFFLFLF